MKVRRYTVRGRIQRKGIAATSCVRCVVTASSRMEALAESPSHNNRRGQVGLGAAIPSSARSETRLGTAAARHAVQLQITANATYAPDQISPCVRFARFGSMNNG